MVFANRSGVPLRRSPDRRVIGGVCGGMAEWLGVDPWLMRLIFVLVSIASSSFPGILVYIALWVGLPTE
jgi:phage shock protein C